MKMGANGTNKKYIEKEKYSGFIYVCMCVCASSFYLLSIQFILNIVAQHHVSRAPRFFFCNFPIVHDLLLRNTAFYTWGIESSVLIVSMWADFDFDLTNFMLDYGVSKLHK